MLATVTKHTTSRWPHHALKVHNDLLYPSTTISEFDDPIWSIWNIHCALVRVQAVHWTGLCCDTKLTQGFNVDMSPKFDDFNPSTDIRLSELSDQLTIVTVYFYIPEYRRRGASDSLSRRDLYRQVIVWKQINQFLCLSFASAASIFIECCHRFLVYAVHDHDDL